MLLRREYALSVLLIVGMVVSAAALGADRSVVVRFHNHTNFRLTLTEAQLIERYGQWLGRPPAAIEPNSDATWKSESSARTQGVSGHATFTATGFGSTTVVWNNPFQGISTYQWSAPDGYTVELAGGKGADATIDFTLHSGAAPVRGPTARNKNVVLDTLKDAYDSVVKGTEDAASGAKKGADSFVGNVSDWAKGAEGGAKSAGNDVAGGAKDAYVGAKNWALGFRLPIGDPFAWPKDDEDKFTPHASWMADLANTISGYKLCEVIIPGTHDSGTYPITSMSPMSPYTYKEVAIDVAGHLEPGLVAAWARAQGLSVYNQLNAGARWLDVRPGWDPVTKTFRTHHSMWGAYLAEVLGQIKRFIDEQPREVVILEISHTEGTDQAGQNALAQQIVSAFGANRLIPRGADCPTFKSVWATQQRVVVLYSQQALSDIVLLSDPTAKGSFWGSDNLVTNTAAAKPTPGSGPVEGTKEILQAYIDGPQWKKWSSPSSGPTRFFSAGLTITPDTNTILGGFTPAPADFANSLLPVGQRSSKNDTPHSLEELARMDNPTMVG